MSVEAHGDLHVAGVRDEAATRNSFGGVRDLVLLSELESRGVN